MRILMLAQAYAPIMGGEERVVENLSNELAARGHDVVVAALRQPVSQVPTGGGVRVHELRSTTHRLPGAQTDPGRRYAPPAPDPETVRDLRRVLAREQPDVVHAHNLLVHSFLPLKRRSGAALALSVHDYSPICAIKRLFREGGVCTGPGLAKCVACAGGYYGRARGTAMALGTLASEPRLRRHVDLFLPVSRAVWELCRPRPGDRHIVVSNFLREPPARVADDPRLAQLPENFLLFFGDVMEEKGVRVLVDAYARLDDPPPLVLLGRQHAGDLSPHPMIRRLGPWPRELAMEALHRSLFVVAPSIWAEPGAMVAYETAYAGKPLVASRIGGLQDIVVDGETGLLVAPADVGSLRDAIAKLIADKELRERLGAGAAAHAREHFSAAAVVPRYEQAYQLALELNAARAAAP